MIDNYEFKVGGSLGENAPSYVVRRADEELYHYLKLGEFCYIFNSRQMGKTSLIVRTRNRLQAEGYACTSLDFSVRGSGDIKSEQWYAGIVYKLVTNFELGNPKDFLLNWWKDRSAIAGVERLDEFIETVLLTSIKSKIVVFIDEIDSILSLRFPTDDFFALIRSCYEKRNYNPEYKRLTFALVGVATPGDLIGDKRRTPFNIGKAIQLDGFQESEIEPLAKGFEGIVENPLGLMKEVLNWTGGQPFLTQKVCKLLKDVELETGEKLESIIHSKIIDNWEAHDEPEHLKTIRDRMLLGEQIAGRFLGLYQQILLKGYINADNSLGNMRFRLLGLVVKEDRIIKVYNRIYKSVFNLAWVEKELGKLRPYAESFQAWVDTGYQDESRLLRGQALQNALHWANEKNLSNEDARYLRASQELEKAELAAALATQEEKGRILAQANKKLRQAQNESKQANETLKLGKLLIVSFLVTSLVMGIRYSGYLQSSELHAYDRFMQLRSQYFPEERDPHLLIVTINEQDIKYQQDKYNDVQDSLSDKALSELLQKLDNLYQVKTIGLDLHRTHRVKQNSKDFTNPYEKNSLFVVCKAPTFGNDGDSEGIRPPLGATPERIGFSDFIADDDKVARRHLLSMSSNSMSECNTREAFSVRLALNFLKKQGKKPSFPEGNLQIEDVVFKPLEQHSSGYQTASAKGHQILLNYRSLSSVDQIAETVSLRNILSKSIQSESVKPSKERIAIIGRIAPTDFDGVKDPWKTPFSSSAIPSKQEVPGVFIQAQMVSQIISSVLYKRPLLWWWSPGIEALWILAWSIIGGAVAWCFSKPSYLGLGLTFTLFALFAICFIIFLSGGWIPFIPSVLGLFTNILANLIIKFKKYDKKFTQELTQDHVEALSIEDAKRMGRQLRHLITAIKRYPLNSMTEEDLEKQLGWNKLTVKQVLEMALASELIVEVKVSSSQGNIVAFRLR